MKEPRLKSSMTPNNYHKKDLKRALMNNYASIHKGDKQKSTKRFAFNWQQFGLVSLAAAVLVTSSIVLAPKKSTPFTAQRVFALASENYQKKAVQTGRYLHIVGRSEVKFSDTHKSTPFDNSENNDVTFEHWIDTETKNSRDITRNKSGKVLYETLILGGNESYYSVFEDSNSLVNTDPEASFKRAGITDVMLTSLSMKEIDDLLMAAGEKPINTYFRNEPIYTLSSEQFSVLSEEEQKKAYGAIDTLQADAPKNSDEAYAQCIDGYKDSVEFGKIDVFLDGSTPTKYAQAFEQLAKSDRFTITHSGLWQNIDTFGVTYKARVSQFGDFTAYFSKDDFRLVGMTMENMGMTSITVFEKSELSDVPFSTSSEGLERMTQSTPELDVQKYSPEKECADIKNNYSGTSSEVKTN
jgi:hypothetical protein